MANSKLVEYTKLSPNHSGRRTHKIDKIAIHHMAGAISIETCGSIFANPKRMASSNYAVGNDGRVAMYVEEHNRSWCTSSPWCDQRAVTIEVANSKNGGDWPVSDVALERLIELCVDICRRNGIYPCTYTGSKDGTLQKHEWYASTNCPGPYLGSKFSYIANEVTRRLGGGKPTHKPKPTPKPQVKPDKKGAYLVRVTARVLNVRDGDGTNYKINTTVKQGEVYTIVDTKGRWGKLKSGAGWICLDYAKRV